MFENIAFPLRVERLPEDEAQGARSEHAARILQLEQRLQQQPGTLSGGQRQRVAIGRAIVREPKIFLFDEPLSNLDAALRADMRIELMRAAQAARPTMIYVTHDQVEAMTMADRIVVLNAGEIAQIGGAAGALSQARQPLRRRLHRQPEDELHQGTHRVGRWRRGRRRSRCAGDAQAAARRQCRLVGQDSRRSASAPNI